MFLTSKIILISSLFYIVMARHLDFRERFLERKRLRSIKDQRIKVLNNYVSNNTEILDDITYYKKIKGRSSPTWKKIRAIEKDFRRLLAMNGMKYNYKRGMFWRTWRRIPPVNGATTQIVSYKCNNPTRGTAKECQNCGMWTIEKQPPPCPYEFFSMLSDEKLCGLNYTQYKDVNNSCPSVIKFSDLTATCDNPIETQWRFSKMYGVTEKYDDVICENKDFCEIFTSYEITPEHVVFRIINSTNDVIYSRIMKEKNRNYICVKDCGRFNPNTRKVAKADKPLKLDLLTMRKTKREYVPNEIINDGVTNLPAQVAKTGDILNEMNDSIPKRKEVTNEMNDVTMKIHVMNLPTRVTKTEDILNEVNDNVPKREVVPNEVKDGVMKIHVMNLPTRVRKTEDILNEMNENVPKIEDVSNEINHGTTKIHVMNKPTRVAKTKNILNEEFSSEMYDGLHLQNRVLKSEEALNDILAPMEENMSLSNFGGNEYVRVSIEETRPLQDWDKGKKTLIIEENSGHKTKLKGMKERQLINVNSIEKRFLMKPTLTPCLKLKKETNHRSYEDSNLEMDY